MKKIVTLVILTTIVLLPAQLSKAGNKDRAGQAGATELLINPWGQSAGLHGMNSSFVHGAEAMRNNVAGLTFINKTQLVFANSMWLKGSGVTVNALGFAQRLGESNVLGINVFSMGFGEIPVTTVSAPEGNSGATFRPQLLNLGIVYARSFSNSIHVGFQLNMINHSIADANAFGAAFDMGIQYVTGPDDNIHFGISLRNVGTPMRFAGDGLATKLEAPQGYSFTVSQRTEKYELPSTLNIGAAYDILMGEHHRLTVLGNFTSNSFSRDQFGGGIEYAFHEMFMLRGGYRYEDGIAKTLDFEQRATAYTGLCGGVSVEVPFKKGGESGLGIDYAYRATNPYNGTHTIGVRINL